MAQLLLKWHFETFNDEQMFIIYLQNCAIPCPLELNIPNMDPGEILKRSILRYRGFLRYDTVSDVVESKVQ